MPPSPSNPQQPTRPNDFGSDLWIRSPQHRHSTAGRGLFAGLQDVKNYNVDQGWARRQSASSLGAGGGFWGFLERWVWGKYTPPRD